MPKENLHCPELTKSKLCNAKKLLILIFWTVVQCKCSYLELRVSHTNNPFTKIKKG